MQQIRISGIQRRALLLRMDRLPATMAKPHHKRLARAALLGLAHADRAQSYELTRGRLAIIWRGQGGHELTAAMAALDTLLADLPAEQALAPGQLVSVYDLPEQAAWLLDELAEQAPSTSRPAHRKPLDPVTLAQLEQILAQADVAPFVRWRSVLRVPPGAGKPGWDERYVATREVAARLCPDRNLKSDAWLFRRLTRSFDRRMLALLTGPSALGVPAPFGLHLNVGSILSPDFLRFDEALPGGLRGHVVLYLESADMLADAPAFSFARNFARSRGYRLLLRSASPGLLAMLDLGEAGFDFAQIPFHADTDPAAVRCLLPAGTEAVFCENDAGVVHAGPGALVRHRERKTGCL